MSDIPEADKGVYGSDAENGNQNNLIDFLTPDSTTSAAPLPVPLPSPVPLTPVQAPSSMSTAESITPSTVSKMATANSWLVNSGASSPKSTTDSIGRASPPTIMPPPPPPQASILNKVFMSSEAHRSCLTHLLSTELEEVIGLLLGQVDATNGHCYLSHALPLKRLHERKDLMKIDVEKSGSVSRQVNFEEQDWRNAVLPDSLSVVGWYHSHCHIKGVNPSELDILTHHQYQSAMPMHWIGLILGELQFDEATRTNQSEMMAFQAVEIKINGGSRKWKHVDVPIVMKTRCSSSMIEKRALKDASTLIDLLFNEFMVNRGNDNMRQGSMASGNVCEFSETVQEIIARLEAPLMDSVQGTYHAQWVNESLTVNYSGPYPFVFSWNPLKAKNYKEAFKSERRVRYRLEDELRHEKAKNIERADVSDLDKIFSFVRPVSVVLVVDGRQESAMEFEDVNYMHKNTLVIKEGCQYRLRIEFYVRREIGALKYIQNIFRDGVQVEKKEYMLGSYGPLTDIQSHTTPVKEASGMVHRGTYKVKSLFTDDDNHEWLAWQWNLEIKKDWD